MKTKPVIWLLCSLLFIASATFTSCKSKPKDADITAAIQQKLSSMPGISVSVKDGVATLTGECKDESEKSMTESEVKAVPGVTSVVNNCTITPPSAPVTAPVVIAADDPLIKSVTDAIKDYNGVKADVKDGVVTLTGEIKRTSLPKLLQAVMASKPKKVENKLVIK